MAKIDPRDAANDQRNALVTRLLVDVLPESGREWAEGIADAISPYLAAADEVDLCGRTPEFQWDESVRNDGYHEYAETFDCQGDTREHLRRLPALHVEPSSWEKCEEIPADARHPGEDCPEGKTMSERTSHEPRLPVSRSSEAAPMKSAEKLLNLVLSSESRDDQIEVVEAWERVAWAAGRAYEVDRTRRGQHLSVVPTGQREDGSR